MTIRMTQSGGRSKTTVRKSKESRRIPYTLLSIIAAFALLPVTWMIVTAVTSDADIFQFPPSLLRKYTFEHFVSVFNDATLLRYVINGFLVSAVTCLSS